MKLALSGGILKLRVAVRVAELQHLGGGDQKSELEADLGYTVSLSVRPGFLKPQQTAAPNHHHHDNKKSM